MPDLLLELTSRLLKSSRGRLLKAREFVQQAKSSFVYVDFILPSWIDKGNDHREQTLQIYCVIMHMQPTENPHSLYFNQFTAPLYMHQLFWQTNVVLGNERGGGVMDLFSPFRRLMLLY